MPIVTQGNNTRNGNGKRKTSGFDIIQIILAVVGVPWLVLQTARIVEEEFSIPFKYTLIASMIVVIIIIFITRRDSFLKPFAKIFKPVYKFIVNLRYIHRLDEVEPFKKEKE